MTCPPEGRKGRLQCAEEPDFAGAVLLLESDDFDPEPPDSELPDAEPPGPSDPDLPEPEPSDPDLSEPEPSEPEPDSEEPEGTDPARLSVR